MNNKPAVNSRTSKAAPHLHQRGAEMQSFNSFVEMPISLPAEVCKRAIKALNQILADTITIRDLYKKHHWQVAGPTFYQLHLLFDKHYEAQAELVDAIAERIQLLGGVSVAMAADVAEISRIERPPQGREEPTVQISRLLEAHQVILKETHEAAETAEDDGDHGSTDLLTSKIIPANEFQVWFLSQHLVETSVVATENTPAKIRASA